MNIAMRHNELATHHESAIGEVAGSFLLGIVQSFYNLSVLPKGALDKNIVDIDIAAWYPYSTLLDLKSSVKQAIPSGSNICFRAGMNFLRIWYEQGPGKKMIGSGLDWLHVHQDGSGYNSVVRGGNPSEIGWHLLQSIDEAAGVAVYEIVSPLMPDFVNGLFYGGCLLFDDMEYVNVASVTHPYAPNPLFTRSLLTVNFRMKPKTSCLDLDEKIHNLQPGSALTLSPEEVESLIWRHKGFHAKTKLDSAYCSGINVILADAIATSHKAGKELKAANLDLIQAQKIATSANRELSDALKFNETILLNSPIAMGVYAADGQCVEVNDAYVQLVGRTREALLERNFRHLRSWAESGALRASLKALSSNSPQRHETYIFTHCDKALFVEYRILPVLIHDQPHLLVQLTDLSDRKRMEDELRHFAFHDALTQLPNRRLLLDRLKRALLVSKRSSSHIAVLFVDLNKFKYLNDTYGHETGDLMLIEVAGRIKKQVRETDTVARLGGDEFVILLEGLGADAQQASLHTASVTEKIRQALTEEYILGDIRHHGSASVGSKFVAANDIDPDQIIKEADTAMYVVKAGN